MAEPTAPGSLGYMQPHGSSARDPLLEEARRLAALPTFHSAVREYTISFSDDMTSSISAGPARSGCRAGRLSYRRQGEVFRPKRCSACTASNRGRRRRSTPFTT